MSLRNKYSFKDQPKKWQGIELKAIRHYRSFINRELPGFCGTYTVAALIHYCILTDRNYDLSMEPLLQVLKPKVDDRMFYRGTYPWDLVYGLRKFFKEDQAYRPHWHIVSNPAVVEQLSAANPLPVIVGTTKAFGSRYGNHWVLVYAYGYNNDGKLFYRAYDNHGKVTAVIPASQTLAAVWLERL